MHRSIRVALATALLGSSAVAASALPSAAARPAPTVSSAAAAPGETVTVSVDDCSYGGEDDYAFLQVLVFSGTGPDAQLIGVGSGDDGTARFVVPDWVDPNVPASVRATCLNFGDFAHDDPTLTAYDPVPFTVLPGTGPVTQTLTLSRSSLLVGQAFKASARGCSIANATSGDVSLFPVDDTMFEGPALAVDGFGEMDDAAFDATVTMANSSYDYEFDDERTEYREIPSDIAPGEYRVVATCSNEDGDLLVYPSRIVTVTGSAPVDDIDLTGTPGTRRVTVAGGSCLAGSVQVSLWTEAEFTPDPWDEEPWGDEMGARSLTSIVDEGPAAGRFESVGGEIEPEFGDEGILAEDGYTFRTIETDESGAWSYDDSADVDQGAVLAEVTCGDPLEDGFVYDTQVVRIDVPAAPTPPTSAPARPVSPTPAPKPANAVRARPTYAG